MQIEKELLDRILINLTRLRAGAVSAIEANCDSAENSEVFLGALTQMTEAIKQPFNEKAENNKFKIDFANGEAEGEDYEDWVKHMVGCFAVLGICEAINICNRKKEVGTLQDIVDNRPGWSKERAELWLEQNEHQLGERMSKAFKNAVKELLAEQKR